MRQPQRRWFLCVAVAAVGVLASGVAGAQQEAKSRRGQPKGDLKGTPKDEKVSGVIVKVEDLPATGSGKGKGKANASLHGKRLTINTAAVWRDWVRDQATTNPAATPKEAAKAGENSVATKGQPKSEDTLVIVDVLPASKVETRFRSSTDEASEGATSPAAAADVEKDPADTSKGKDKGRDHSTGKPPQFDSASLKPGLFVDVQFRHDDDHAQNRASTIFVVRPIGGPNTGAGEAAPTTKREKP